MSNILYFPVSQRADLLQLDEDEIYKGYRAAFVGESMPSDGSCAFWHGWRNGCADSGRVETDDAMRRLASKIINYHRGKQ